MKIRHTKHILLERAIPLDVKHWHGAAPDSWFSHIAIAVPGTSGCDWLEAVTDEYENLK